MPIARVSFDSDGVTLWVKGLKGLPVVYLYPLGIFSPVEVALFAARRFYGSGWRGCAHPTDQHWVPSCANHEMLGFRTRYDPTRQEWRSLVTDFEIFEG